MIGFPHLANMLREAELVEQTNAREREREAALAAEDKDYGVFVYGPWGRVTRLSEPLRVGCLGRFLRRFGK